MKIAEKIRSLRKDLGYTQKALAEKVGVSRKSIIFYETGERCPRPYTMRILAKVLGVSVEYLLTEDATNPGNLHWQEAERRLTQKDYKFYDERRKSA